jgi:phospholipid/cholesterol/gamma-HCH transport system permease protein
MSVEVRRTAAGLQLELAGQWGLAQVESARAQLAAIELGSAHEVELSTRGVESLDLSGAWVLHEFVQRARAAGAEVSFQGAAPDQLRLIDEALKEPAEPATAAAAVPAGIDGLFYRIGHYVVHAWHDALLSFAFLGHTLITLARSLGSLRRLRPTSVARHVYETGITAMPITALIAFLVTVIIAYLSAQELRGLGVDIYVVDLVTIGVLRELGVLLTSIITAGRSASSYAAELGSMQLNEEVDALIATGVDPFEVLVVPRVVAFIIALPLLTVIADLVGLTGGALLCRYLLDMPLTQYINRVDEAISPSTFWVGLIKAPVFALLIALAGCYRGMQVRGSARELGHKVTVAVVQAIFLVILADAVFAIVFMKLDI